MKLTAPGVTGASYVDSRFRPGMRLEWYAPHPATITKEGISLVQDATGYSYCLRSGRENTVVSTDDRSTIVLGHHGACPAAPE